MITGGVSLILAVIMQFGQRDVDPFCMITAKMARFLGCRTA